MTDITLERASWKLGDPLADGAGGFGRVYRGIAADGSVVAIKLVPKDPGASRELLFDIPEAEGIVPVLDRGEWGDHYVIVMPMAKESLRHFLQNKFGPVPFDEASPILIDIARALIELKGANVVHRDLKPDNVLRFDGTWRIADFGIARYAENTTSENTRKFAMTPPYAAPEQWTAERASNATDVYAFGVIAFELLEGRLPFPGPYAHDFRQQHLESSAPTLSSSSPTIASLVTECLYKDPGSRPAPENIVARLDQNTPGTGEAFQRLQAVNRAAVEKKAEQHALHSAREDKRQRRSRQFRDASESLSRIKEALIANIRAAAPSVEVEDSRNETVASLQGGKLGFSSAEEAPPECLAAYDWAAPFDVVAYASIGVKKDRDRYDYEGRTHSLWFCDAQEENIFRWYELSFMVSPMIAQRFTFDPFQLPPTDKEAAQCLTPVMTTRQLAWQPVPIDQGEQDAFIERWINWFAASADGSLSRPTHMPENSGGSFRFDQRNRRR